MTSRKVVWPRRGEMVENLATGHKITGRVVDVLSGYYYAENNVSSKYWKKWYPNWEEKPVIVVKLDQQCKQCTLEEMLASGSSQEEWQRAPLVEVLAFPVDDLRYITRS